MLEKFDFFHPKLSANKELPQQLMNHVPFTNGAARKIVEKRGYEFKRLYQRMKIELQGSISESLLRGGLKIGAFKPEQDEDTLFEVYDETFRDSWGYSKKDAREWIRQQKGRSTTQAFGSSFGTKMSQSVF